MPAGDSASNWLRFALPLGVNADLAQSMFVDVRPSAVFREKLRQLKITPDMNVPVALKRQLAEEQHLPYFTDGLITRNGEQITLNLGLYESAQGKQIAQHAFTGTDLFSLIDEVAAALRKSLELPETKDARDLRVSDVLTTSVPAFRSFSDGITEIQARDGWASALPQLEKAVEIDPQFAQAQLTLHSAYVLANQANKSMPPLQKAMDYEYRLPERTRYDMRAEYFMMKQDKEKAYAVAKMKVQLYPEDLSAYALLAQFQRMRRERAGLIESFKKMLELDPSQQELVRQIGTEYESQAQFDSALHYYSRYAELFPARKEPFIAMAGVYRLRGEPEQARANYTKALVSAPGDMSARLGLGAISMITGEFDAARKQYEDALSEARTPDERSRAAESLAAHYEQRGQFNKAITYRRQALEESRKLQSPLMVDMQQLSNLGLYVRAGRVAEAQAVHKSIVAHLQPPFTVFGALGEMEIALELRQPEAAAKAVESVDQGIKTVGFDLLNVSVVRARARLAELGGNCEEAIKHLQQQLALEPNSLGVPAEMARCYRTLGQIQTAIEHAQKTLKVRPFDGRANYEIALDYLANNDRTKALEHLRRAVQVWSDADPTYTLAADAKKKLRELEAGSGS